MVNHLKHFAILFAIPLMPYYPTIKICLFMNLQTSILVEDFLGSLSFAVAMKPQYTVKLDFNKPTLFLNDPT
jgi:hypothetical protein